MFGFPLAHGGALDCKSVESDVLHFQIHEVAATELAVDREIKHCEIARSVLELQFGADRPDLSGLQRGFGAEQFPFILGDLERGFTWKVIDGLHDRTPLMRGSTSMLPRTHRIAALGNIPGLER